MSFPSVRLSAWLTAFLPGRLTACLPVCLSVWFFRLSVFLPVRLAAASGAEDPGFESRLRRDFPGSSHTSDFTGTPVATLPGAWHYRVSAVTGRSGVSIL